MCVLAGTREVIQKYSMKILTVPIISLCDCPVVLSEVTGRRWAIIVGGVIFTVGGGLQAASFFLWWVIELCSSLH